jgi:hypothetical protein
MNKLVREVVVVVICAAIFASMPMFLLGQASPGKIVGTVKARTELLSAVWTFHF